MKKIILFLCFCILISVSGNYATYSNWDDIATVKYTGIIEGGAFLDVELINTCCDSQQHIRVDQVDVLPILNILPGEVLTPSTDGVSGNADSTNIISPMTCSKLDNNKGFKCTVSVKADANSLGINEENWLTSADRLKNQYMIGEVMLSATSSDLLSYEGRAGSVAEEVLRMFRGERNNPNNYTPTIAGRVASIAKLLPIEKKYTSGKLKIKMHISEILLESGNSDTREFSGIKLFPAKTKMTALVTNADFGEHIIEYKECDTCIRTKCENFGVKVDGKLTNTFKKGKNTLECVGDKNTTNYSMEILKDGQPFDGASAKTMEVNIKDTAKYQAKCYVGSGEEKQISQMKENESCVFDAIFNGGDDGGACSGVKINSNNGEIRVGKNIFECVGAPKRGTSFYHSVSDVKKVDTKDSRIAAFILKDNTSGTIECKTKDIASKCTMNYACKEGKCTTNQLPFCENISINGGKSFDAGEQKIVCSVGGVMEELGYEKGYLNNIDIDNKTDVSSSAYFTGATEASYLFEKSNDYEAKCEFSHDFGAGIFDSLGSCDKDDGEKQQYFYHGDMKKCRNGTFVCKNGSYYWKKEQPQGSVGAPVSSPINIYTQLSNNFFETEEECTKALNDPLYYVLKENPDCKKVQEYTNCNTCDVVNGIAKNCKENTEIKDNIETCVRKGITGLPHPDWICVDKKEESLTQEEAVSAEEQKKCMDRITDEKLQGFNDLVGGKYTKKALCSMRTLDLSGKNLSEIPFIVFGLRNLTKLDLSNNNLKGVSERILIFKKLQELDLSGNTELKDLSKKITATDTQKICGKSIEESRICFQGNDSVITMTLPDGVAGDTCVKLEKKGNVLECTGTWGGEFDHGRIVVLERNKGTNDNFQHIAVEGDAISQQQKHTTAFLSEDRTVFYHYINPDPNKEYKYVCVSSEDSVSTHLKVFYTDAFKEKCTIFSGSEKDTAYDCVSSLTQVEAAKLNTLTGKHKTIAQWCGVKDISITGKQLTEVPQEVLKLRQLTKLDLSNNKITNIPDEIVYLHNLQEVSFSKNEIKILSNGGAEGIYQIPSIEVLDVSYNKLSSLHPYVTRYFPKLKKLVVAGNNLATLDDEFATMSLQEFDLQENPKLKKLSKKFVYTDTNVVCEEVSHGNYPYICIYGSGNKLNLRIGEQYQSCTQEKTTKKLFYKVDSINHRPLPTETCYSSPFECLGGKYMYMYNLNQESNPTPDSMNPYRREHVYNTKAECEADCRLSLADRDLLNSLTGQTKTREQWCVEKELSIEGKKLTQFPPAILKLTNLTALSLGKNEITEIPNDISDLYYLKELDLRDNKIKEFSYYITKLANLKEFRISRNQINSVPKGIKNLEKLEILDIAENNISQIPSEIGRMKQLKYLIAQDNQLTALPNEIQDLKLKWFTLSNNPGLGKLARLFGTDSTIKGPICDKKASNGEKICIKDPGNELLITVGNTRDQCKELTRRIERVSYGDVIEDEVSERKAKLECLGGGKSAALYIKTRKKGTQDAFELVKGESGVRYESLTDGKVIFEITEKEDMEYRYECSTGESILETGEYLNNQSPKEGCSVESGNDARIDTPPIIGTTNGKCSTSEIYKCVSGKSVNPNSSLNSYTTIGNKLVTIFTWDCEGNNGGTTDQCVFEDDDEARGKGKVDGKCSTTKQYECISGRSYSHLRNIGTGSSRYEWKCKGYNGGTTSEKCSYELQEDTNKKEDGKCSSVERFRCETGYSHRGLEDRYRNDGELPEEYTWECRGINGGKDVSCSDEVEKIDAVCGEEERFTCKEGNAFNRTAGMRKYQGIEGVVPYFQWKCGGQDGGEDQLCDLYDVNNPVTNIVDKGLCYTGTESVKEYVCKSGKVQDFSRRHSLEGAIDVYSWICEKDNGQISETCFYDKKNENNTPLTIKVTSNGGKIIEKKKNTFVCEGGNNSVKKELTLEYFYLDTNPKILPKESPAEFSIYGRGKITCNADGSEKTALYYSCKANECKIIDKETYDTDDTAVVTVLKKGECYTGKENVKKYVCKQGTVVPGSQQAADAAVRPDKNGNPIGGGSAYVWKCGGERGWENVTCKYETASVVPKPPVVKKDGECFTGEENVKKYVCKQGTVVHGSQQAADAAVRPDKNGNPIGGGSVYVWKCGGENGGQDVTCEYKTRSNSPVTTDTPKPTINLLIPREQTFATSAEAVSAIKGKNIYEFSPRGAKVKQEPEILVFKGPGKYTQKFTVTDSKGNKVEDSIIITILPDKTKPVIELLWPEKLVYKDIPKAIADINSRGNIARCLDESGCSLVVEPKTLRFKQGQKNYSYKITATDEYGNTSRKEVKIIIEQ